MQNCICDIICMWLYFSLLLLYPIIYSVGFQFGTIYNSENYRWQCNPMSVHQVETKPFSVQESLEKWRLCLHYVQFM